MNMGQKQGSKPEGKQAKNSDDKGRRVVYSTDPDDSPTATVTPPALVSKPIGATNPAGPIVTRQQNQPVIVGIERKGRGGKTVSIVAGVMSHEAGKQALLKLLKTKIGTGGTLKDDVIEIQGDHRDQIVELLTGLGYKAKKSGG
jgi:translation initiation factor 1